MHCLKKTAGKRKQPSRASRWLVTWLNLEKDSSQPEATRRELLVFEKDEDGNLVLSEV